MDLKDLQRILTVEKGGKGMTIKEISEASGLPEDNVKMSVSNYMEEGYLTLSREGNQELYRAKPKLIGDDSQ